MKLKDNPIKLMSLIISIEKGEISKNSITNDEREAIMAELANIKKLSEDKIHECNKIIDILSK